MNDRFVSACCALFGVLGLAIGNFGAVAAERIELPPGPNRDLVSHTCQACHDLDNVIGLSGATVQSDPNARIAPVLSRERKA